ncbi:hypothetical protein Tco_0483498 [Tanacetum coccineum]
MLKTIIHAQTIQKRLDDKKLQIQECTVQEVKALDAISEDKAKKSCMHNFLYVDQLEKQLDKEEFQELESMAAFKVLETQFQMFIKSRMYLDDEFVVGIPKSSGTTLKEQDTSSKSGKNDAHADDAEIRPIYDDKPMAEV